MGLKPSSVFDARYMNAGALSSILAAKKKAVESLEFCLKHRFTTTKSTALIDYVCVCA